MTNDRGLAFFGRLLMAIIFLIAVLDNPYRGKVSVTPEPLERVYQQIMVPGGK